MMSLGDTLSEIVVPAIRAVFKEGEVSEVSVRFEPELHGGSITLSLTAVGERFSDLVVQGDVDGCSAHDWRERLRSDLAAVRASSSDRVVVAASCPT